MSTKKCFKLSKTCNKKKKKLLRIRTKTTYLTSKLMIKEISQKRIMANLPKVCITCTTKIMKVASRLLSNKFLTCNKRGGTLVIWNSSLVGKLKFTTISQIKGRNKNRTKIPSSNLWNSIWKMNCKPYSNLSSRGRVRQVQKLIRFKWLRIQTKFKTISQIPMEGWIFNRIQQRLEYLNL